MTTTTACASCGLPLGHRKGCEDFRLPGVGSHDATTAWQVLDVISELSARWHRAQDAMTEKGTDPFTFGRMEGYAQSIALLLGTERTPVKTALEEGKL